MSILATSAEQTLSTALLGSAVGTLSLRLNNTSESGKIFRIVAARCAIGRLDSCDLRFAELEDCHCIIVRGRNAALIRCWSPNTRLNGRPFRDAVLRSHDQLTLGPLEFEVLMENDRSNGKRLGVEQRGIEQRGIEQRGIEQRVDAQLEQLTEDLKQVDATGTVATGTIETASKNDHPGLPGASQAAEQLEAEVERLSHQVESERATIAALQAEIERLTGTEPLAAPTLPLCSVSPDGVLTALPSSTELSLESYVYQVLDRIRGKAHRSTVVLPEENAPRIESELMEALQFERQASGPAWEPRSSAPELNADLEAMRRLANDSARSALDHFAWRKSVEYARQHWSYAGFGLFWATVAWLVLKDNAGYLGRSTACVGIGLALVLAGVGALRAVYWKPHDPKY